MKGVLRLVPIYPYTLNIHYLDVGSARDPVEELCKVVLILDNLL